MKQQRNKVKKEILAKQILINFVSIKLQYKFCPIMFPLLR